MKLKPLEISLDLPIKTYDIDFAGIVSNIVYIRWLEDLRLKMFEHHFAANFGCTVVRAMVNNPWPKKNTVREQFSHYIRTKHQYWVMKRARMSVRSTDLPTFMRTYLFRTRIRDESVTGLAFHTSPQGGLQSVSSAKISTPRITNDGELSLQLVRHLSDESIRHSSFESVLSFLACLRRTADLSANAWHKVVRVYTYITHIILEPKW